MLKLKSQTAMEYLMTYSWAFLIVIVIGALLFAYGVFTPASLLPKSGCVSGYLFIESADWFYSPDGTFTFALQDRTGQPITIRGVNVTEGSVTRRYGPKYGWWQFDEGSGTTTADSSGSGNTGNLVGGVSWVPGKFGNALNFDGSTGYVLANGISDKKSLSLWLKTDNLTQQQVFDAGLPITDQSFGFGLCGHPCTMFVTTGEDTPGSPYFAFWDANDLFIPHYDLADGQWHHIAVSWDGDQSALFGVDGQFTYGYVLDYGIWQPWDQPLTFTDTPNPSNQDIRIGGNASAQLWSTGSKYFNGTLDEVRIYDRALSQQEIIGLSDPNGLEFIQNVNPSTKSSPIEIYNLPGGNNGDGKTLKLDISYTSGALTTPKVYSCTLSGKVGE